MMITIENEGLFIYPHRGALSPLDMSFREHVLSLLIITIYLINYYVMNIYLYVFVFITKSNVPLSMSGFYQILTQGKTYIWPSIRQIHH
jgi:hypothetical protein